MDDQLIETIATEFADRPGVSRGRAFATDSLMVNDKIFALFRPEGMVFKLPVEQCQALVREGAATPFSVGKRAMKEWVVVPVEHSDRWANLAEDAFTFAGRGAASK